MGGLRLLRRWKAAEVSSAVKDGRRSASSSSWAWCCVRGGSRVSIRAETRVRGAVAAWRVCAVASAISIAVTKRAIKSSKSFSCILDSKLFELGCIEADGSARDDTVGKDKDAWPQVDSGFRETVAKHVEAGAVSGRGVGELAEEEDRRIGRDLPRWSRRRTVRDPQKEEGGRAGRAESSEEGQCKRQVVSCSKSLRCPARGVGRAEAAFEETCDVRRKAKCLGAVPEEVARGGPSGPGPGAKSAEPPGEIADGLGCPSGAFGLGSLP
jgi:hypothetical protein